jgi:hypothetical protein
MHLPTEFTSPPALYFFRLVEFSKLVVRSTQARQDCKLVRNFVCPTCYLAKGDTPFGYPREAKRQEEKAKKQGKTERQKCLPFHFWHTFLKYDTIKKKYISRIYFFFNS